MANITIIRGDSYAIRRPLYTYTFVDENGEPFDLAGCTIRTTYKATPIPIELDPDDQTAIIRHQVTIDANGIDQVNDGLYLLGPSINGVVVDRMTSAETKNFIPETLYLSDLQLTDYRDEVFTWIWSDAVVAIDSVTNRDS